jgi:hypothetical protein
LAICLILAYNVTTYRKEDESVYDKIISPSPQIESKPATTQPVIEQSPIEEIPKVIESPIEEPASHVHKDGRDDFFRKMFKTS